ncbi:hypothetical protein ACC691_41480, partial [Rhizobium johnstonii]|uniref:hypothetical protein n=1 Tax=Rhizobium johnstonii TaxID=3019933 RepID=UPI003F9D981C
MLIAFAVIAGGAIWLAARGWGKRLHRLITASLHTSGQFAVRLVLCIPQHRHEGAEGSRRQCDA